MPRFIFNNQSVINSYGFKIPNDGIKKDRFLDNPVMLDEHYNSTSAVLGAWKNISVSGDEFSGEDDFDIEDPKVKLIAGKVERGYIKGCSMGVTFDRDKMKQEPDGTWLLTECELYEVSIVAVPSNKTALRLFNTAGKLMTDEEVKLSISELSADFSGVQTQNNNTNMFKLNLSAQTLSVLGLSHNPENESELVGAVNTMVGKLTAQEQQLSAEKTAHEATKLKLKNVSEAQAKALSEELVLSGKITLAEKDQWFQDAMDNYALTAKFAAKLTGKESIGLGARTPSGTGEALPKTVDEFEKLSDVAKLSFQKDHRAEYDALFKK